MEKFKDIDLIVVKDNLKNKIIKEIQNYELINIKIMSFRELRDKYYYTYDERALYYLISKYNYNIDVAKMYLSNFFYVDDCCYNSSKIRKIIDLKDELKKEGLLIYNNAFRNYLKDKTILIYNYNDLSKSDNKLILDLKKDNVVNIVNEEVDIYRHEFIYQADTLDLEVEFVASDIVDKINSGIDINRIKLCGVVGEYESVIKRVFDWYNIPITISTSTLYATKIGQDAIDNLDKSSDDLVEYLKDKYGSDENIISIINKIIKILNKYVFVDKNIDAKALIIDDFKNIKINSEKYSNEVGIILNLDNVLDTDIVYLLGFNQGDIPKCYKDEDYFDDILKEKLGIDTTKDINIREYNKWLFNIKKTKNLVITSKKISSLGEHYLSSLVDELNLKVNDITINYNYSNMYNKIKLAEKLDILVRYNEKTLDLEYLYNNYRNIDYNTYDSSYKKIDSKELLRYLDKKLVLSYSSMNTYYQCAFRYYLSNILKLNIFEETFYTVLGNLFHYVLSNYYKDNFDLKKLYYQFLSNCTYQFDEREKFFLEYLETELEFIVKTIVRQNEVNNLNNILAEEKIEIDKSREDIKILFKGFVDKIMLNDDNSVISIVDYKTGNPKLNLNNVIYGLDLQLPIYIYLARYKFKNAKIAGFYLQKILNSEIIKDFKHTYQELKEEKLKLQGYSNSSVDILELFDSSYNDSRVIKGMRTSSKGISSKKIFDDVMLDKLIDITEDKIDEVINSILDADFDINPKRVGMNNVGCEFCKFKDICFMKEEMVVNLKEYKNMEFLGDDFYDTN